MVPASNFWAFVLASVVLTTLPILVLYAAGRRQLLSGLTAGFGR